MHNAKESIEDCKIDWMLLKLTWFYSFGLVLFFPYGLLLNTEVVGDDPKHFWNIVYERIGYTILSKVDYFSVLYWLLSLSFLFNTFKAYCLFVNWISKIFSKKS